MDDFDLDNNEPIKYTTLDLDKVKTNVPTFTSQKLCEMIVCDRYFGFNQQIAIICMEELSKRRINGDAFKFEDYIEESFNKLPKLNFNSTPDLRTVLHQVVGRKNK